MKEFLKLIPAGWTFRISHDDKNALFRITIFDNIGAGNDIFFSIEFAEQIPDETFKEMIELAKKQINQLYGL